MTKAKSEKHLFDKFIDWIQKNPKSVIWIFIGFLIITFFIIPFFLIQHFGLFHFDDATAHIGDTVGGITSPIIALFAAFLTFIAFWIQYKANIQLKEDIEIDRFESKFFEQIRLHKENINELRLKNGKDVIKGREVFSHMLKSISKIKIVIVDLLLAELILNTNKNITGEFTIETDNTIKMKDKKKDPQSILDVEQHQYIFIKAYRIFFSGINEEGTIMFEKNDKKYSKLIKDAFIDTFNKNPIDTPTNLATAHKNFLYFKSQYPNIVKSKSAMLSHYYRHLFHTVKYVVNNKTVNEEQKKDYLRIFRSQLSDDEQLLLYYNYVSGYGENWENENNSFLCNYKMIHNMPLNSNLSSFYPQIIFKNQIESLKEKDEILFENWEWS